MSNMEQWLDNIVTILRTTNIPQIKERYADWNWETCIQKGDKPILIGKCALGVLSCENGLTLTPESISEIRLSDILKACKVPEELIKGHVLPTLMRGGGDSREDVVNIHDRLSLSDIGEYIFVPNDSGYTFKDIADFLETTFGDYDSSIPLLDIA